MGHHVRAKFRCLSITTKYDGLIIVELKPVQQKGVNPKENAEFWSYTPSGECQLVFHKTTPIKVGDYHYIDMVLQEGAGADCWNLDFRTLHDEGAAEVYLSRRLSYSYNDMPEGFLNGYIKMHLEPKAKGAIESFNRPGSKWKVEFTFAEGSDGEP